jgi:hypothetical protein
MMAKENRILEKKEEIKFLHRTNQCNQKENE